MRHRSVASVYWTGLLGGLMLLGSAEAGTFRFEDESGVVHYTNVPSDPRYSPIQGWPEPPREPKQTPPPASWWTRFRETIRAVAQRYRVDPRLIQAVIAVESGGNPGAVSPKGAQGLMQLMPDRAAELGVRNPFDPHQNLEGGVRHLRDLLERFGGDVTLALAAYNAGEGAVRAYQGIPPFPETRDYVRKVRALYSGTGNLAEAAAAPTIMAAPQLIYRHVDEDGTVTFTNLPPRPITTLERRF